MNQFLLTTNLIVICVSGSREVLQAVQECVLRLGLANTEVSLVGNLVDIESDANDTCVICEVDGTGTEEAAIHSRWQAEGRTSAWLYLVEKLDPRFLRMAYEIGAIKVLEKPINTHELHSSLEKALERVALLGHIRRRKAEIQAFCRLLTRDESIVLAAMIEGKPNKTIAREMAVALRTIEKRRHDIFKKSKTDSLAHLFRMLYDINWQLPSTIEESLSGVGSSSAMAYEEWRQPINTEK